MPPTPTGVEYTLVRGVTAAQFGHPVEGHQVELAEGDAFVLDDPRQAAYFDSLPFLKKGKPKAEPE